MSQLVELDPVLVSPLRRPEKKAPRKRPVPQVVAQARPAVMQTAWRIVFVVGGLVLAGRLVAFATEPVVATYRMGLEINQLRVVRAEAASVNERLRADIEHLRKPAGLEEEARRRGYVKPGEVALALVVSEVEAAQAQEAAAAAARPMAVADRIRHAVDTCLSVLDGSPKKK